MATTVGTAVIALEPLTDALWLELMPLLERHYREIATYQDIPLSPDRGRYQQLQDSGVLRVYTARADGVLVGYVCYLVSTLLHYSTALAATQDVLWLERSLRGLSIGRDLLRASESLLANEGVQVITQHGKFAPGVNIGAFLKRQGYTEQDVVYIKRLER